MHIRFVDKISTFKGRLKSHLCQSTFTIVSSYPVPVPQTHFMILALYKFVYISMCVRMCAIKRCIISPLNVTCASALRDDTLEHKNRIFTQSCRFTLLHYAYRTTTLPPVAIRIHSAVYMAH